MKRGVISLERLVELMSAAPRRLFGLGGALEPGEAADFTVLDLGARHTVDPETFLSKGRSTPFAGWPVEGRAVLTAVGGRAAWTDPAFAAGRMQPEAAQHGADGASGANGRKTTLIG